MVKPLPDREKLVVNVIKVRKMCLGKVVIIEEEGRWEAFDKLCDLWFGTVKGCGQDEKKRSHCVKRVMDKKFKEFAHKMIEWEAETDFGDESVDTFA